MSLDGNYLRFCILSARFGKFYSHFTINIAFLANLVSRYAPESWILRLESGFIEVHITHRILQGSHSI